MSNFIQLEMANTITMGSGETKTIYEKEWFNLDHIINFFPPGCLIYLSTGERRTVKSTEVERLTKVMTRF